MGNFEALYDSNFFTFFLLPFLIFLSRILDVTIGTIRIVMVAKNQKITKSIMLILGKSRKC